MSRDEDEQEPTEKTAKGYEVPVPTRSDFLANLKKAAKPDKGSDSSSAKK